MDLEEASDLEFEVGVEDGEDDYNMVGVASIKQYTSGLRQTNKDTTN